MGNVALSSFIQCPVGMKFDGEDDDEHIILFLRKHFVKNTRRILIAIFFVFLPYLTTALLRLGEVPFFPLIPLRYRFIGYIFWYLFVFSFVFETFLLWFFHVYIVTNKRIVDMDFHGLLHKDITEAPLRNIEDITRRVSGASQIVFNYGNILIQTAGEKRELEFEYVPNPAKVQDIISDLVSELKHHGS